MAPYLREDFHVFIQKCHVLLENCNPLKNCSVSICSIDERILHFPLSLSQAALPKRHMSTAATESAIFPNILYECADFRHCDTFIQVQWLMCC